MARLHAGLTSDELFGLGPIPEEDQDLELSRQMYSRAAAGGVLEAAVRMAKASEDGNYGGAQDFSEALRYWKLAEAIVVKRDEADPDRVSQYGDVELYQVSAAQAALLLSGGPNLDPDPAEAARLYGKASESAMRAGRFKTAEEYMMLGEEAGGM